MSNSAWEDAWNRAETKLFSITASLSSSHPPKHRIIRVGQLDSELLDRELTQVLQEPINKALSLVNVSFKSKFEPELTLLIQLILYKLSIWNTGASYGAKLQDLRYVVKSPLMTSSPTLSRLPRGILAVHGALTLFAPYLHTRIRSYALSHAWPDTPLSDRRRKAWDLLDLAESTHTLLGLVNFVAFLWNGRYRTLADRILGMRLVPSRRQVKRDVSYEFMNRQMVWHAFTEFLLFLLPLINARMIRLRFYRLMSWFSPRLVLSLLPKGLSSGFGISQTLQTNSNSQKFGKFWSLPGDQCAICAENASFNLNLSEPDNIFTSLTPGSLVTNSDHIDIPAYPINIPYITSCGHIYCYHCVAERMVHMADDGDDELGWECLRCGEEAKAAERYSVEISESDIDASGSEYEFSSDLDMYTDMSGSMGSYSESVRSE